MKENMKENAKEKLILRALGNVDNQYIREAEPAMEGNNKTSHWRKWISAAACLAVAALLGIAAFQSGVFGRKTDTVTLASGETITFVKGDLSETSLDLDVTTRPLREDEIQMLFSDLPVAANACFDTDNHTMLGLEGKLGDVRLVISRRGVNLLDTVVEGSEYASSVGGVDISAGYFVTKANSQGVKTVIYYASFELGENRIYAECAGVEGESETVKHNLADAILKLIENGEMDLNRIQE